jgi:glyoxylase-like metal-dependent hydrolase (beta-lactamase superfamily II)
MNSPSPIQLEDELGDVLEKAMRRAGCDEDELAAQSGVPAAKIRDAIDYRPELDSDELRRLAAALKLNEVGLCALGRGRYPLPEIGGMPFCVRPLRMAHGIGVVNAYLVTGDGGARGLLFDTGADIATLETVLSPGLRDIDAVFLTHVETEHAGGLCDVVAHFGKPAAFIPEGAVAPCGNPIGEGQARRFGRLEVTVFGTPGHSAAHNCYVVRMPEVPGGCPLLVSGDLIFAGSAGGGYFCHKQLQTHLNRVLKAVPPCTVIAPGHGPLTTVENELRYNPFLA